MTWMDGNYVSAKPLFKLCFIGGKGWSWILNAMFKPTRSNQCIRPFIFGTLLEKLLASPVCRGTVSRKTAFLNCGFPLFTCTNFVMIQQCVQIIQLLCSSNVLLETCFAWSKEVFPPPLYCIFLIYWKMYCIKEPGKSRKCVFNILPLLRTTEYAVLLEEIVHKKKSY